jgi:hypothetical protein
MEYVKEIESKFGERIEVLQITTDKHGNIIVAEMDVKRLQIFSRGGNFVRSICSPSKFNGLSGVAVNSRRDNNVRQGWRENIRI